MVRLDKSPFDRKHLEVAAFVDVTRRFFLAAVGALGESRSFRSKVLIFLTFLVPGILKVIRSQSIKLTGR